MKFHCFFEQSGTFKNEFKKLGYQAYDYDILNDFNETDYVIDLFDEIEKGYVNIPSIFDKITCNDMILAFFPCVRFEDQSIMNLKVVNSGLKNYSLEQKLEFGLKTHKELSNLYELLNKLTIISIRKDIPLIIENPYSTQHYLHRYWHLKPKIIDKDRTENGDNFKKPTQYWFINCEPKNNFIFEPIKLVERKIIDKCNTVERSMINPQYANRFIREFIIDEKNDKNN